MALGSLSIATLHVLDRIEPDDCSLGLRGFASSPIPLCPSPVSHSRSFNRLSTSCTTTQRHSNSVVLPPHYGSITLESIQSCLLSMWKENFPDPEKSPAVYTRSLFFRNTCVTDEDLSLIKSFTQVERLEVLVDQNLGCKLGDPFAPFHNLSSTSTSRSTVKSLCVG